MKTLQTLIHNHLMIIYNLSYQLQKVCFIAYSNRDREVNATNYVWKLYKYLFTQSHLSLSRFVKVSLSCDCLIQEHVRLE